MRKPVTPHGDAEHQRVCVALVLELGEWYPAAIVSQRMQVVEHLAT